jgi:hypothetical protein
MSHSPSSRASSPCPERRAARSTRAPRIHWFGDEAEDEELVEIAPEGLPVSPAYPRRVLAASLALLALDAEAS